MYFERYNLIFKHIVCLSLVCLTRSYFSLQTSATGGLGSVKAEVMADTAVALAAANVPLVSSKIIGRLNTVNLLICFFEKL